MSLSDTTSKSDHRQHDGRILRLSQQLMDAQDVASASAIGDELRQAIHDHIDRLRVKVTSSLYIAPPPVS